MVETDYPYLFFYLIITFFSFLYWKTHKRIYAFWAFIVAFVFFGFRAPVVGADTWNYVRYLTGETRYYNDDPRPLEPLFIVYREIVCCLTSSRFIVMIVNTVISFAPLLYITKKYSLNPPFTILLFCFLGGMNIYFCGLRQIIALAVLYIGLIYWLQFEGKFLRRLLLLLICIIIAFFFHTSSALYSIILVVALVPFKIKRITYVGMIVGTAIIGILLEKFDVLDFFSLIVGAAFSMTERLEGYLLNNDLNDTIKLSILLRLSVVSIIAFIFMPEEKLSHPFSKIFLAEVIMFNFLYSVPIIHRICFPLSFFGAVVLTWVWDKHFNKIILHRFQNLIIFLVVIYFLRAQIIQVSNWDKNDPECMHPYYFIFEDYPSMTAY